MGDSRVRIGNFLGRVAQAAATGSAFRLGGGKPAVDHDLAAEAARAVTGVESAWLQGRIDADAALDPLEQALLDFIAEEQRAA
jgi:hypothetical protein